MNDQRPATLSGWLIAKPGQEHRHAVDQHVDANEDDPDQRTDEGQQANDDEQDASEQQHPPFLGQLESQPARGERPFAERSPARPHRASLTHTDPLYTAPRPNSRACPCNLGARSRAPVANATCLQSIIRVPRTIESCALQARIVLHEQVAHRPQPDPIFESARLTTRLLDDPIAIGCAGFVPC